VAEPRGLAAVFGAGFTAAPGPDAAPRRSGGSSSPRTTDQPDGARELLEQAGYEVEQARDGREAIQKALAPGAAFDLVLMDVQMPEVDGFAAAARIREVDAKLPIIAMTAHALESERRRCIDAGMNDHVPKPVEPAALLAALDRWLRPAGDRTARALRRATVSGRRRRSG